MEENGSTFKGKYSISSGAKTFSAPTSTETLPSCSSVSLTTGTSSEKSTTISPASTLRISLKSASNALAVGIWTEEKTVKKEHKASMLKRFFFRTIICL